MGLWDSTCSPRVAIYLSSPELPVSVSQLLAQLPGECVSMGPNLTSLLPNLLSPTNFAQGARRLLISEILYEGITEDAGCFRRSCLSTVLILESFCFCQVCFTCCSNPSGSCSRATEHSRGWRLGYGFRNDVSKLPLHLSSTATLQDTW
jgi:hypothetical protein